jgi:hypothetical protein
MMAEAYGSLLELSTDNSRAILQHELTLIDNLVISGNETTVAARLTELLGTGIDELMVSLVPITDAGEDEQQTKLMHLIGRL